jgi:hypothetical protein
MKRFIAPVLAVLFFLSGCATPPSQQQIASLDYGSPPHNHEATIKRYFDNVLFDPYSAHYDFELPQQYWVKDAPLRGGKVHAGYFVRVGVNAKNRMGGYVGKKVYGFIIKDERIIKVMDEFELQNMRTR